MQQKTLNEWKLNNTIQNFATFNIYKYLNGALHKEKM